SCAVRASDGDAYVDSDVDPHVDSDVDSDVDPHVDSDIDPHVDPDIDPHVDPDIDPDVDPHAVHGLYQPGVPGLLPVLPARVSGVRTACQLLVIPFVGDLRGPRRLLLGRRILRTESLIAGLSTPASAAGCRGGGGASGRARRRPGPFSRRGRSRRRA